MDRSAISFEADPERDMNEKRRRRIDEEHARLRTLLEALEGCRDAERLDELLAELHTLLVAHFETEEGPEGLHEIVGQGAGHRMPDVQRLFVEHREILARVSALSAEVTACLEGPVRKLVESVAALVATLRHHEHVEEEIFTEAFYTDIGGRS